MRANELPPIPIEKCSLTDFATNNLLTKCECAYVFRRLLSSLLPTISLEVVISIASRVWPSLQTVAIANIQEDINVRVASCLTIMHRFIDFKRMYTTVRILTLAQK